MSDNKPEKTLRKNREMSGQIASGPTDGTVDTVVADEIAFMITLLTAHIRQDTIQKAIHSWPIYKKGGSGWFIYVPSNRCEYEVAQLPVELVRVMDYARIHQCQWLCLDSDGKQTTQLPTYNW